MEFSHFLKNAHKIEVTNQLVDANVMLLTKKTTQTPLQVKANNMEVSTRITVTSEDNHIPDITSTNFELMCRKNR